MLRRQLVSGNMKLKLLFILTLFSVSSIAFASNIQCHFKVRDNSYTLNEGATRYFDNNSYGSIKDINFTGNITDEQVAFLHHWNGTPSSHGFGVGTPASYTFEGIHYKTSDGNDHNTYKTKDNVIRVECGLINNIAAVVYHHENKRGRRIYLGAGDQFDLAKFDKADEISSIEVKPGHKFEYTIDSNDSNAFQEPIFNRGGYYDGAGDKNPESKLSDSGIKRHDNFNIVKVSGSIGAQMAAINFLLEDDDFFWAPNQPEVYLPEMGNGCVLMNIDGEWQSEICQNDHVVACRHRTEIDDWVIAERQGTFIESPDACLAIEGDYQFIAPVERPDNDSINKALKRTNHHNVWVNQVLSKEDKWISLSVHNFKDTHDNITFDKTVTQSADRTDGLGVAELATDTNNDGIFSNHSVAEALPKDGEAWWEIDLENVDVIRHITIWNRTDECCRSSLNGAVIQVMDSNHNEVASQIVSNVGDSIEVTFLDDPVGKYVRITKPDGQALSLSEVQVWSENPLEVCQLPLKEGIKTCELDDLESVLENIDIMASNDLDVSDALKQIEGISTKFNIEQVQYVQGGENQELVLTANMQVDADGDNNTTLEQSVISTVTDEYGIKHLLMTFELTNYKWATLLDYFPSASPLANTSIPTALITILLSGDGLDDDAPIYIDKSDLPELLRKKYEKVYGASNPFELRIVGGINLVAGMQANKLPAVITDTLGLQWNDNQHIVFAGSLGANLEDLSGGSWSKNALIQAVLPVPNLDEIPLGNVELADFLVSLYISETQQILELGTRAKIKMSNKHDLELYVGMVRNLIGNNKDVYLSGHAAKVNDPFAFSQDTLERVGVEFYRDEAGAHTFLGIKGEVQLQDVRLRAEIKAERIVSDGGQNVNSTEILFVKEAIESDVAERLMSEYSENLGFLKILPDRIQSISNFEIRDLSKFSDSGELLSNALIAKGDARVCLIYNVLGDVNSSCRTHIDTHFEMSLINSIPNLSVTFTQPGNSTLALGDFELKDMVVHFCSAKNTSEASPDYIVACGESNIDYGNDDRRFRIVAAGTVTKNDFSVPATFDLEYSHNSHGELRLGPVSSMTMSELGDRLVEWNYNNPFVNWSGPRVSFDNVTVVARYGAASSLSVHAQAQIEDVSVNVLVSGVRVNGINKAVAAFNIVDQNKSFSDLMPLDGHSDFAAIDALDFSFITLLIASHDIDIQSLPQHVQNYFNERFGSSDIEIKNGIRFVAKLDLSQNSLGAADEHLDDLGYERKDLLVQGGLSDLGSNQPNFELIAKLGYQYYCDEAGDCNDVGWFKYSDLQLYIKMSSLAKMNIGVRGELGIRNGRDNDHITDLVMNGSFTQDGYDSSFGFCAIVNQTNLSDRKAPEVGKCLTERNHPDDTEFLSLFELPGVKFNRVGFDMKLHRQTSTLEFDVAADLKIDVLSSKNIYVDHFGGTLMGNVPVGINLSIYSPSSFDTDEILSVYNYFVPAGVSIPIDKMPTLRLSPMSRGKDSKTGLPKENGIVLDIAASVNNAIERVHLQGRLAFLNASQQTIFEQDTIILVDDNGFHMNLESNVYLSGQVVQYVECGLGVVAGGAKCALHVGRDTFYCGQTTVGCGLNKVSYFLFSQLGVRQELEQCQQACEYGIGYCKTTIANVRASCNEPLLNVEEASIKAGLTVDIASNGFSGEGRLGMCRPVTGCLSVKGSVSLGNSGFSMGINTDSSVPISLDDTQSLALRSLGSQSEYPYAHRHLFTQFGSIDFNGDGRGDLLITMDHPDVGDEFSNDWLVSYNGRSELVPINGGQEIASDFHYGDFNADGKTDLFVEKFGVDSYAWNISDAGIGSWETQNQPFIFLGYTDDDRPIVSVNGGSNETVMSLRIADLTDDGRADVVMLTRTGNAQVKAYLCDMTNAQCIAIQTFAASIDHTNIHIGNFVGDARPELFISNADQWQILSNNNGNWSLSAYRNDVFDDIADSGKESYYNDLAHTLRFGDFNADGYTDVFTARTQDELGKWIWRVSYSNGLTGEAWTQINAQWDDPQLLQFGDLSGNGFTDVFVINDTETNGETEWNIVMGGTGVWQRLRDANGIDIQLNSAGEVFLRP